MKTIKFKDVNETFYKETMPNGLDVYMWPSKNSNQFYFTLNIKYGSNDIEFKLKGSKKINKVPYGVAHFLEHVNFNEKDGHTAHEYYAKLGSSINAFTSYLYTAYEVVATSLFKENLTHLLDYVETPCFTDENVSKEKGIIIEEINMYKDSPMNKLHEESFKQIFNKSNYSHKISGEVEDVKKITKEDLNLVYETFYHPKNMFLVITGNFDPKEAIAIIKENESNKKFLPYKEPIVIKKKENSKIKVKELVINGNVSIPKVMISFKMEKSIFKGMSDIKASALMEIILVNNFSTTSNFYEEMLTTGIVSGLSYSGGFCDDIMLITINAETMYPETFKEKVLEKVNDLETAKIDIERIINYNLADSVMQYENVMTVNSIIESNIVLYNDIINDYEFFSKLTYKDVLAVKKILDFSSYAITILESPKNG